HRELLAVYVSVTEFVGSIVPRSHARIIQHPGWLRLCVAGRCLGLKKRPRGQGLRRRLRACGDGVVAYVPSAAQSVAAGKAAAARYPVLHAVCRAFLVAELAILVRALEASSTWQQARKFLASVVLVAGGQCSIYPVLGKCCGLGLQYEPRFSGAKYTVEVLRCESGALCRKYRAPGVQTQADQGAVKAWG